MTGRARRVGLLGSMALALAVVTASCGIPTGGGPTAIGKNDVPFHLPSPSSPTTSSTVPAATVSEYIFLVSAPTQTVAPVSRYISVPTTLNATLTEVLTALLEGPTATEATSGLETLLTGAKTSVSAKVSNGIATVDFTANPIQVVGTSQTLAIAQLVFTATQQPGVTGVLFQISGQPIEVPTASGATVPGPVDRSAYQPYAPVF